jgi:type II secretory pathway predicted ATPase ExeA
MYEQYFDLRGRPFATAPDPDFYFESRGHHRALAYLRHGVREGDSFMVMTGEIGAGKTTLVHKLMRELDTRSIAAALLVSSQLDARELLATALGAFGAPGAAASMDEMLARLRATLASLASQGRRALLVIDEAQNLQADAIELVTGFAARQTEGTLALQVLLVGQPELRRRIQSDPAAAQRQPVFLFCHIGMLSEQETRDYVVHRLRHVGWADSPSFADLAFQRIHQLTDGVPRRINRLCDRLLLACYLRAQKAISPRLVEQADAELRGELGEGALAMAAPQSEAVGVPDGAPPPRTGPSAGRAIPTLTSWVPPTMAEPAAAPSPATMPSSTPAAAPADLDMPAPRRARPGVLWLAAGAVLVLAVLVGSWVARREPSIAPASAPAPSAVAPARAPAPLPTPDPPRVAERPAPPPSPPPAPTNAPCTAAVIALGLCAQPATSPKE